MWLNATNCNQRHNILTDAPKSYSSTRGESYMMLCVFAETIISAYDFIRMIWCLFEAILMRDRTRIEVLAQPDLVIVTLYTIPLYADWVFAVMFNMLICILRTDVWRSTFVHHQAYSLKPPADSGRWGVMRDFVKYVNYNCASKAGQCEQR